MTGPFRIGQLAEKTDLSTSAIRYYERLGLLQPLSRSHSGYRMYDDSSIERLRFIAEAHSAGFTLEDIKALLRFRDGSRSACGKVRSVIEHRLADVERQMVNLKSVRCMLHDFRQACEQVEQGRECPVLEDLTSSAKRPPSSRQKIPRTRSKKR